MIRFKIRVCFMFMAGAALIKDLTPKTCSIMAADGMRCVAVIADRQFLIRLGYGGAMNRGTEFFSNT